MGIISLITSHGSAFESLQVHQRSIAKSSRSIIRCLGSQDGEKDEVIVRTIDTEASTFDWDDRIDIQKRWTNSEKGWNVGVEWKETPYGAGLFATQDIDAGTLLRKGRIGLNLIEFQSIEEIDIFCRGSGDCSSSEMDAKLMYVKDYLWGFNPNADERGYDILDSGANKLSLEHEEARFFGMWVPGNGLNHSPNPNTVYRAAVPGGTEVGIDLFALIDISKDDELLDDYRRHGTAPTWLLSFARERGVTLNFAECNDFVVCSDEGKGP
ncbi:unnamed protein product [Cylindrotheca closterium]|uniref:SET domain-containing protein n=1 Tax=Cylindrotheca closterium TaxID=2856 RepID=A0AAD2JJR9_9STRA|nr:unnamed protein product [Cylindrotheca closterium]